MAEWDQRFSEAHDYAINHGVAMAFPNFHEADYGAGIVRGTHLLPGTTVEWRDVPAAEYGGVPVEDVPAMFRAATDYAGRQGFPAAMPNFHSADWGQGLVYGTFLFRQGSVEWRDVPRDTLGVFVMEDVPGMMTAAHDYAIANGFAAGFPTFHQADHGAGVVCGVMLIRPDWVSWRDVPADLLRAYSDRDPPWAVILCRLSDVQAPPNAAQRWVDFFTEFGADESGAYRYWRDVSYGMYYPSETRVFGPLDIGHTRAELNSFTGTEQRQKIAEWGIAAARADGVPLERYPYRIVGLNADADHGATGGLAVLAYRDGRPFEPTFMLHEMGHVLRLDHSFGEQPTACAGGDDRPGAYCDVFDVMSAMNVRWFNDAQGRRCGPGLAAPNLQRLGWLHRSRVVSGWPARSHTVKLAALNRPDIDGPLALQLGGWPFRADYIYVEFRQATGWDRGIGGDVVVLHTIGGDGLTRLLTNSGRGGTLLAGDEIVLDGLVRVVVRVASIDSAAGTAVIRFWPLLEPGPREVRIVRVDFDPTGPEVEQESLVVRNDTSTDVDLQGWRVEDVALHVFTFPQLVLEPGEEVTVWTGRGSADANNLHWGRRQAVWNNTGDTATLRRPDGTVASQYAYGDGGTS